MRAGDLSPVARRSPAAVAFMTPWLERFFRRHLNALRLARWGRPLAPAGPLIVYANHPGWWDPVVFALLARRLFPDRAGFGPIDAAMLARYGFFARIGLFGVEQETRQGAARFLRTAREILSRPDRLLILTAQGRFADPRERPLGLKPGVAHLAELAPDATFLPLALDYAFWTERGAEALAAFGSPLPAAELARLPRPARLPRLEAELAATMDRLAADAIARDPARFDPLLAGRPGIGGVYDLWRRGRALIKGERFDPAHRSEPVA